MTCPIIRYDQPFVIGSNIQQRHFFVDASIESVTDDDDDDHDDDPDDVDNDNKDDNDNSQPIFLSLTEFLVKPNPR